MWVPLPDMAARGAVSLRTAVVRTGAEPAAPTATNLISQ